MRTRDRQQGYSFIDILVVVGLIGVISAVAIPMTGTAVSGQRFKGDAQALNNLVGLAKMRASSGFTRARVRANLADNTFVLEQWDKVDGAWVTQGGIERTFRGVRFGFGDIAAPPPGTQVAIGQSPPCRVGIAVGSVAIGNTACIVFNSRGLPVDGDGALFGGHAFYLTDGNAAHAVTVTNTPRIRLWWAGAAAGAWREQQ